MVKEITASQGVWNLAFKIHKKGIKDNLQNMKRLGLVKSKNKNYVLTKKGIGKLKKR
jgi:predicted transcriptional regulator